MKKILLFLTASLISSCTTATPLGKCVGLNGHEEPNLIYEYSAGNIGLGLLFAEFVIPPIVVALDELKCPVRKK